MEKPATGSKPDYLAPKTDRKIDIRNLLPGDLIFHWGLDSWAHVGICSDVEKTSGIASWVHGVYRTRTPTQGVWKTKLNPPKADDPDQNQYRVLRCRHPELRQKAAGFAAKWAEYLIPYAHDRLQALVDFEKDYGANALAKNRQRFKVDGKFRAIKYAARRDGPLCFLGDYDEKERQFKGKGLTCGQFVVICYQVAGIVDFVLAAPLDPCQRVSDKKLTMQEREMINGAFRDGNNRLTPTGKEYLEYTERLRISEACPIGLEVANNPGKSTSLAAKKMVGAKSAPSAEKKSVSAPASGDGKKLNGAKILPSILLWDSRKADLTTFPWQDHITSGMILDSKLTFPNTLYLSLDADNPGWEDLGSLTGAFTADKTLENQFGDTLDKAKQIRANFFSKNT